MTERHLTAVLREETEVLPIIWRFGKAIMRSSRNFYRRPTFITIVTVLLMATFAVTTTFALTRRQEKELVQSQSVVNSKSDNFNFLQ